MAKNKALVIAFLDRDVRQRAVAHQIGMAENRLSRIIHGYDEPTADEKKALARVLRKPVAELFPTDEAIAS